MTSQEGVEPAAKVMKEEKSADSELERGSEGAPQPSGVIQPQHMTERLGWRAWREGKREPCRGMQQRWEAQWQEFLKTLQAPHSAWGNPQLSETAPWDDAKAFLASFEQVAEACRWPRKEWAARLLPALSGEAKQAFSLLGDGDKEDYGKVKAAILRGDAMKRETQRQHFRQFCCPEIEDPRKMYVQLQELCCQWLKPERHTKEQILELLVLEQFLASLPVDVQSWIRAGGPDSCSHAVALLEDFLMSRREAKTGKWQGLLLEERVSSREPEEEPLDAAQEQIFAEAKQNGDGEMNLLGSGIRCPSHSSSLLPPEGQEMAEAGPAEGQMNIGEAGVPLHMVERNPIQPSQGTMFWKVLQEEDRRVDSLEGLLVPKPDPASHLAKEEKMFHQFPVESERLPGEDSGLGPRTDQAPPQPLGVKLEEDTCLNFPAPSGHPADFWERPHTTTTGLSQRWWTTSSSKSPATASQPPSFTAGETRDSHQSKKVRAKPWTEFETGTFLDLWLTDYVQEGLQNQFRNEAIYNWISKEMAKRGYERTSSQCREKINQLKKKFKDVTTHNSRSGVEPRTMPHYDKLATVLLCRKDAAAGHGVGGGTPIPDKRQRVSKMAAPVAVSGASIAAHTPVGGLGRVTIVPRTSPVPSTSAAAHTLPDAPEQVAVVPHTSSPVPSTHPTAVPSLPSKRPQYQVIARAVVHHTDVLQLASARPTAPPAKHPKHLRSTTRRPVSAAAGKSPACLESRPPRTPIEQGDEVEVCLLDPQGETIEAAVYTQVEGGDEEEALEEIHLELDPAVAEQLMRSLEEAGEPAAGATPIDSSVLGLPPDSGELFTAIPPRGTQSFGEDSSAFEGFRSSSMEQDGAAEPATADRQPSSGIMEGLQCIDEPLPRDVSIAEEEVLEEEPSPDEQDPAGGREGRPPAPEGQGGSAERCALTHAERVAKKKKENRQAAVSQRPCGRNSQNRGKDEAALA